MKLNGLTKTIAGTATALAIIGGVWAADMHFVPRETHNLEMAAMSKAIQGIVRSNQIQRAQDEVFFWMRTESQLREQLARDPRNQSLMQRLQQAEARRRSTEKRLRQLQCQ